MLCYFLPYNIMNRPYVYIYPLPLDPPTPPSYPSRPSQGTRLSFLCHHSRFSPTTISHAAAYACRCYSLKKFIGSLRRKKKNDPYGRNINNLRYAEETTLKAESEEELKSVLMKVKVENEKVGLKLNIQKTKIMASGPMTSWQIDGETVETVSDFIFWWAPKSL